MACHESMAQWRSQLDVAASGLHFNYVPLWGCPSCRFLQTPAESHSSRVCFVVLQPICYEPFSLGGWSPVCCRGKMCNRCADTMVACGSPLLYDMT